VLPKLPPTSVVATAYCGCPLCCGKWSTPKAITASGNPASQGFTIAADWKVFPEDTCLVVQGLGKRVVHDTGSAIKGAKIDVYFESHEEAKEFGVKRLEVKPC
jgi:3D (Asp-Asp-Asp) domain-containing protein